MNDLLSTLVGVLLATNPPAAASNLVERTTGVRLEVADPNDPVEREYLRLLALDDAAQAEADRWIQENQKFQAEGAGIPEAVLKLRIKQRFEPVKKAYDDFLLRHPKHSKARIAYGSFLSDIGEEDDASRQWEKALEIDGQNPAIYNNLANHFGHHGPIDKAFEYYEKAIALAPQEAVYYHNFGTTVFLFRRDAMKRYQLSEQQVFDKALHLYSLALKLDPQNFPLATDVAKTYYGIEPKRPKDAKSAWNNALRLAADDIEREGVYLHLARWEILDAQWDAARAYLGRVTNTMYLETKTNVTRNLERRQSTATNAPAAASPR